MTAIGVLVVGAGMAGVTAARELVRHGLTVTGSVDEVSMLGLLEDRVLHLETGSYHRVADGYDRLPDYIGHGLDIRLGFGVETVRWSPDAVSVVANDGHELMARAAISTLPLGVLKSGAVRFSPELPESKRAAFAQLEMGPVLKILLLFQEPFWPPWLTNLGCGTGPVTLYWPVFHGTVSKPAVLTAYCTGPRAARLARHPEDEAVDVVLADLRRLFPRADPHRAFIASRRIDWAGDPFACGGYTFVRPGGAGARRRLAAADTGALFWAGAATATPTIADTVQAAYLSGLRAAAEVRASLENAHTARGMHVLNGETRTHRTRLRRRSHRRDGSVVPRAGGGRRPGPAHRRRGRSESAGDGARRTPVPAEAEDAGRDRRSVAHVGPTDPSWYGTRRTTQATVGPNAAAPDARTRRRTRRARLRRSA
jgi:predicted NAD/FAD-dependent oxidoreductase